MINLSSLEHIRFVACPSCGSRPHSISVLGRHTNGEQFEQLKFNCMYAVEYVPNFSCQRDVNGPCPRSDLASIEKKELQRVYDEVEKIINESSLSDKNKSGWKNYINHLNPTK